MEVSEDEKEERNHLLPKHLASGILYSVRGQKTSNQFCVGTKVSHQQPLSLSPLHAQTHTHTQTQYNSSQTEREIPVVREE